ncbi:MAG TPA: HNH endonuclease [Candidatus Heimdallarchaeota archaeon]|nr:HNH endonuclease [Candidatus Heimdallarchaeota archaeon]
MGRPRDYRREYDTFHKKPEQKKRRAARNTARAQAEKAGRVKKGDGKDVHHKDGNPRNNSAGNKSIMSRSKNRSIQ